MGNLGRTWVSDRQEKVLERLEGQKGALHHLHVPSGVTGTEGRNGDGKFPASTRASEAETQQPRISTTGRGMGVEI